MSTPLFVVVGNVNQGKSSVVAALSENETIPIDSYPGTTRKAAAYVFRTADRELFRIVDTPGFQRPREVLARLQQRAPNAAERPAAVRAFVAEHEHGSEFRDEVELLRPLLEGACILYVVDASSRMEPANEAEMEILRWTGQPAMALINRVRSRDHAEEWRPTLRQFFHIVRDFDAWRARFPDRVALLRGFREIRPEWSAVIDEAVAAMERELRERGRRAASLLGELMVDALSLVEKRPLPEGADEAKVRAQLQADYQAAQRRLEQRARAGIEEIYRHQGLHRSDQVLEVLDADLFAETTWRLFGLSRAQLARYGLFWGAAAGVGIDLAVAGHSLFAFTAIGAGAGALAGWLGGMQVAKVWSNSGRLARTLMPGETGRFMAMGPVTSARYAWVLLDRALVHLRAVRDRSHARRDALDLAPPAAGLAAALPKELRDRIDAAMREVLAGAAKGRPDLQARDRLQHALQDASADQ